MNVPIVITVIRFVELEPEPGIILDTRLYLLSKGKLLVPKVHIVVEKVVHNPRVFIFLVPL